MVFWCISFMSVLMLVFGILRLDSLSMVCSWIAPLTPTVIVISGIVFHHLSCMLLISGSYLACFCVMACSGNLSWQYVNSMSCIVCVGTGSIGVGVWFGAPSALNIYGLNLAWHWQAVCLWTCTFYEPLWDNVFLVHIVVVTFICWLVMFGRWGVSLYCGEQFLVLLDRGVHIWIAGVAMCLCRFCGIMCSWGLDIWEGQKMFFLCGSPCIEHI